MEKHITWIRHGSLPETFAHCFVGTNDVPLSELGCREAAAVGTYLASKQFDAVYSGTLKRVVMTRELAERRADRLPAAIPDTRLNELDFGAWSLHSDDKLRELFPESYHAMDFGNPDFTFPEGENMGGFMKRTRDFLQEIAENDAESIAVFTHGGVIMSLLSDLIGLSRTHCFSLLIDRGSIAEVKLHAPPRGQIKRILHPLELSISGK